MVNGLTTFQKHFADYTDSYILIGGSACETNLSRQQMPFRATRDLDIVLCIEALNTGFIQAFWDFVSAGKYAIGEKSTGEKQFFRFRNPEDPNYPWMLEVFSRRPDLPGLAEDTRLVPIPADDEASSLSAILLDDDYYRFILEHRIVSDGLSIVSPEALIVLKAKAWLDLRARKTRGEHVDSKNISKHKNDIARVLPVAVANPLDLPETIHAEMETFLQEFHDESIDAKALGIPFSESEVKRILQTIIG